MDLFSAESLSALLTIILIDLVLAGDNALVIGLVARQLPKERQWTVILWGTAGAIVARVLMAIIVVYILKIPGFLLIGGLALVWIARKLVAPQPGGGEAHGHGHAAATSMAAAIRTIVVADAVMGIDNVLAIGGVARDSILLLIIGLAISIPIVVWGSRLVILLVDRFPSIILIGGAVLAWTAAKMILDEPLLKEFAAGSQVVSVLVLLAVVAASLEPWIRERLTPELKPLAIILPGIVIWLLAVQFGASWFGYQAGYLGVRSMGDALVQAVKWAGWLPFALFYLYLRRRFARVSE
ncbi:YjbE family putative metal transport protein [Desertibaculum subflavum]|uniref:YjbE family putative metal transport protein n=1 Tax=Desertibaculum subflavum TaxID=2268458 RepID=UPI000E66B58A